MQILLSMRNQVQRTKNNSILILNLFALQFISLIALNRLGPFYLKIAQFVLIFVDDNWSFKPIAIFGHVAFNAFMILSIALVLLIKKFKYRQTLIKLLGIILLNFKYVMLIPVGCINVKPLITADIAIQYKICCAFNMVITFIMSAIELYTNWSNRFIEKDYCNRRQNSILCLFFQFAFVFSTICFGNLIGSLFLIAVSLFRAYQVSITVQYKLIQSSTFFYSSLNIYLCSIFLLGNNDIKLQFLNLTCKLIIGIIVSKYLAKQGCKFINIWYSNSKNLYKFNTLSSQDQKSQKQSLQTQNDNKIVNNYKDLIIISRILLSRWSMLENKKKNQQNNNNNGNSNNGQNKNTNDDDENQQNQWNLWWQKYMILLASHHLVCVNQKCQCKKNKSSQKNKQKNKDQTYIILQDMRKLMIQLQQQQKLPDIRIMGIYLNIQLTNKPLKAYYQIIRLQREQISITNFVDLQCQIIQTCECFSRIFLINNIQNSNLPLMKIIRFEQIIQSLQQKIKLVLQANINFNQLFTLSSIKINQIVIDSKKIFQIKQTIGDMLEDLVINFPDSHYVNFLSFLFYQYLEVYRSKEKQLKIISQEKNLKRRLFQKDDHDIFNPQFGVIYIDLVEQRGKIKKITKNICKLYGHNYQDMVSFNINQFMPQLFGKHHYKFLANFIQLGKIKILAEKRRLVFAKNKNKFIFPIIVRMKAQYLLNNQFGVTALITKLQTNSQFILFGLNGKIEEVTERLYKIMFNSCVRTQVDKTRRLCLTKMIPNLIKIITDPNIDANVNKVYQSLFIFSSYPDMFDKFRIYRQTKKHQGTYSQSTSFLSSSMDIQQSTQFSMNGIGIGGCNYYADVFKTFLSDLNIVKLLAYNIHYKVTKVKTQQFYVFQLQIVSIEAVDQFYFAVIQEYKHTAEYLNIYEQHGMIGQNFQKFKVVFQRNDVLNFMFNKNIDLEKVKNSNTVKKSGQKGTRKILTIMKQDNNQNIAQSLPSNSTQNFNNLKNGMLNQPQLMQRGGSERSSVTDQTQSQSKKQMLMNAFNSNNCGINRKFLAFINVLIVLMFGILLFFVVKTILYIQNTYLQEMNKFMNLNVKQVYEYRLAAQKISQFYQLSSSRNFTVNPLFKTQLSQTINKLNTQFTKNLLKIQQINSLSTNNLEQITSSITIYDPYLKQNTQITVLELLSQLDYKFRGVITNQINYYFQTNYQTVHDMLQALCIKDMKQIKDDTNGTVLKQVIGIVFGVYQFACVIVALVWIPVLYIVSRQQKRIISLLSTMNIKQLKRVTHKLRLLLQNIKLNKLSQINYIMAVLSDQKIDNALQMQNQKSIVRNIRLVQQNGSYTVKPKIVTTFVITFIIIFSLLPIIFYLNLILDSNKYQLTLSVMQQTSFLADKAPILVNLYLTNINKLYKGQDLIDFPNSLYLDGSTQYFNLTQLISQATQLSNDLIDQSGQNSHFSAQICKAIKCTQFQSQNSISFYDQIVNLRNSLSILDPTKLNLPQSLTLPQLDKWLKQTNITDQLHWITKIYLFANLWNNNFKQSIQTILNYTQYRLIIIAAILMPIYIIGIIYMQLWLIKRMSGILKDAESIHMHFPVQILAQNTYLTSYFNDKIKNNK